MTTFALRRLRCETRDARLPAANRGLLLRLPLQFALRPAREGRQVFQGLLLDESARRLPSDWLISLGMHIALIVAVVIAPPLFFRPRMDRATYLRTYLIAPRPSPAPLGSGRQTREGQATNPAPLAMPIGIPKKIQTLHPAPEAPDLSANSLDGIAAGPDGIVGGVPNGVLEGILGQAGTATSPSAAVAPDKPLQVGREAQPPQLIYGPPPEYPKLASAEHIQGDVQIDAVVDANGNVIQMRVLNGPPLLVNAALQAVGNWKYKPTCFDGVPYAVEMTVDVAFRLLPVAEEAWGYVLA